MPTSQHVPSAWRPPGRRDDRAAEWLRQVGDVDAAAEAAHAMVGYCLRACEGLQDPRERARLKDLLDAAASGVKDLCKKVKPLYDLPAEHVQQGNALVQMDGEAAQLTAQLTATAHAAQWRKHHEPAYNGTAPWADPHPSPVREARHPLIGALEDRYQTVMSRTLHSDGAPAAPHHGESYQAGAGSAERYQPPMNRPAHPDVGPVLVLPNQDERYQIPTGGAVHARHEERYQPPMNRPAAPDASPYRGVATATHEESAGFPVPAGCSSSYALSPASAARWGDPPAATPVPQPQAAAPGVHGVCSALYRAAEEAAQASAALEGSRRGHPTEPHEASAGVMRADAVQDLPATRTPSPAKRRAGVAGAADPPPHGHMHWRSSPGQGPKTFNLVFDDSATEPEVDAAPPVPPVPPVRRGVEGVRSPRERGRECLTPRNLTSPGKQRPSPSRKPSPAKRGWR
eukprot:TRINITY_DN7003_c0_g1_i1.p1 TRINITY_DN7003_c0_g1~~TRINITY_DN7003_c0_g1_i1.p1  ORF type:complete len:457 (+),score=83.44 TRINITY_DN7003_c0_g1_i1:63-1433(+)